MILKVLDGDGQSQQVIVAGQETVVSHDDVIQAEAAQHVFGDVVNALRSGYWLKNVGAYDMFVNDQGDAVADATLSFKVEPGQTWPPVGYPVSTSIISVIGTAGDAYLAREW